MRNTIFFFFTVLLMACNNKQDKTADSKSKDSASKEPVVVPLNSGGIDVDTSLAGIMLLNSTSFERIAGADNNFCFGETYCFISVNKDEMMRLSMHPGNNSSSISEFEVAVADVNNKNSKVLNIEHFTSGKGVKLGMSKQDIINLFGINYKAEDSTKEFIRLNYRIETPADTKTYLLERYNMPIYYSIYEFRDDKLQRFKFGFEYP